MAGCKRTNSRAVTDASSGNGSPAHLCGELLRGLTGIDIVHLPYKGGAPASNDLRSGQVQIYCPGISSVLQLIQGGSLKALAVTMPKRTPFLPDGPTAGEQGLGGPAEFARFLAAESSKWGAVVKKANIKVD